MHPTSHFSWEEDHGSFSRGGGKKEDRQEGGGDFSDCGKNGEKDPQK